MEPMETTKAAYKAQMEAQLDHWRLQLEGLRVRANSAGARARVELLRQADQLKALEASAKKRIAEVEASAADNWHKVKFGFERTWNQLSGSVEAVWAKISPPPPDQN